ncbi:MAG: glycosyltransferase family 4 protein [Vicinamibacterales bacterium]
MDTRRVLVCETQVPLVFGGAEILVRELVAQLRSRGFVADLVSLPFKWYPKEEILAHAAAWRLIDLSESNGQRIDLVIATKFPSYFVRHPNKVTWLVHQHRAAYDLCGTQYGDFDHVELDVGLRQRLVELDRTMLGESKRVYTIGRVTSARLEKYNGISAPPLYHPPRLASLLRPGPYGDYVLSVGRIESIKRVDLAVRALAAVPGSLRLVVVGEGTQRPHVERVAESLGLNDRVTFLGTVSDDDLVALYAGALAVVFAPFDEDYGYVTLEAFLARKPVITAWDSGGPLEFVEDGVNGLVAEPCAEALAEAMALLEGDRDLAARMGEAGFTRASHVTWDGVIESLVGSAH